MKIYNAALIILIIILTYGCTMQSHCEKNPNSDDCQEFLK